MRVFFVLTVTLLKCDYPMNPFVIYGAGCQGIALLRLLSQTQTPPAVHCFIDSHPAKQGQTLEGLPVYAPDYLLTLKDKNPYVAVAVGGHYSTIRRFLEQHGFEEGAHFYDATPGLQPMTKPSMDLPSFVIGYDRTPCLATSASGSYINWPAKLAMCRVMQLRSAFTRAAPPCLWPQLLKTALINFTYLTPFAGCLRPEPTSTCIGRVIFPTPR